MNKASAPLVMSSGQRESLAVLARSSAAAHREVQRAKVLLMVADGVANSTIAGSVGVTPVTVRSWRDRFANEGLAKLGMVREGRGRKPVLSAEKIEEIVRPSPNAGCLPNNTGRCSGSSQPPAGRRWTPHPNGSCIIG